MKTLFYNAKIVGENGILDGDKLLVEDGVIRAFNDESADEKIDCKGGYLFAGFVDIHVHGGGGADFMDGTVEAMQTAVSTHLSHGTTTIYPTTMSAEIEKIDKVFKIFRQAKNSGAFNANVIGLHLEGPFISPLMCGAQRKDLIVSPTEKEIKWLQENADIISRI